MGRYKLTQELLEAIEQFAQEQYLLREIFEELNISKKLMKDKQVLESYDKGRLKLFIEFRAQDEDNEFMLREFEINTQKCELWGELYKDEIQEEKERIENYEKTKIRMLTDASFRGADNIKTQNAYKDIKVEIYDLHKKIEKTVENIKAGDMTELLTVLTSNVMQLQMMNTEITHHSKGDSARKIANYNSYVNLQFKTMQEMRKNIMAINEMVNPKRTTFIKQANQHNHLHQDKLTEISEQKEEENKNELQKTLSLDKDIGDNSAKFLDNELVHEERQSRV